VDVVQGGGQLGAEIRSPARAERTALQHLAEGGTGHLLHDQVGVANRHAGIEHADQTRVLHPLQRPGLPRHALRQARILAADHFHRHLLAGVLVDRSPNVGRPTLAQPVDQPISAGEQLGGECHRSDVQITQEQIPENAGSVHPGPKSLETLTLQIW
jgi:hypothetical protein